MSKLRSFSLLLTTLLTVTSSVAGQSLTREAFLKQLIQTHPLFKKEKLASSIERKAKASYLGEQDWNVVSSFSFFHEEPALSFAGPSQTDAFSMSGGLERVLWSTGGKLTASFSSTHSSLKLDQFYGIPDKFYENRLSLSYVHPLLKNRGGFLNKLEYELKQYDIDFTEVRASESMELFLLQSTQRFLQWMFFVEQISIVKERLHLSEEELGRTREKRKSNLVDEADVIRAEDAVRIWQQNLVLVQSRMHAARAELAVITQMENLLTMNPEETLYQRHPLPLLPDALDQIQTNSRLLKLLRIRLDQLEFSRQGFTELSKPELSLVAELNTKKISDDYSSSLRMDRKDATVGLQFRFPLGNRTALANISKTDIRTDQLKQELQEVILNLTSAYTSLHIQISEMEDVLLLNQEQIISAKKRTVEELNLYNQGRGELTFVIQSRDSEQNARLTYAQNALTYQQLIVESQALLDELYR